MNEPWVKISDYSLLLLCEYIQLWGGLEKFKHILFLSAVLLGLVQNVKNILADDGDGYFLNTNSLVRCPF